MEIEKNDVKASLNKSLSKVKFVIMSHVLMKKNKQTTANISPKALVIIAIQNSIQKSNKPFIKYVECQNSVTKNDLNREYNSYKQKLPIHIHKTTQKKVLQLLFPN